MPGGTDAAGPFRGRETMSTDMLAIVIEICIGILRLIEAAYN